MPDGWARTTAGHAAFTMPENCQQVPLPDDAPLGVWDWVAQDAPTLDDTSVTYRIGVITQGPSAVFDNPPTDDTEFVAQDDGEPEIIVIGLSGLTITEDFLTTFISGIEVLHD